MSRQLAWWSPGMSPTTTFTLTFLSQTRKPAASGSLRSTQSSRSTHARLSPDIRNLRRMTILESSTRPGSTYGTSIAWPRQPGPRKSSTTICWNSIRIGLIPDHYGVPLVWPKGRRLFTSQKVTISWTDELETTHDTEHIQRRAHRPVDCRSLQRFPERRRQTLRGDQGDCRSGRLLRQHAKANSCDPSGPHRGHHRPASSLARKRLQGLEAYESDPAKRQRDAG